MDYNLPPDSYQTQDLIPVATRVVNYARQSQMKGEVDSDSDSGLVEYWRLIKRRRASVVLVTFLCLVASILFTLPKTPLYRTTTSIEIQSVNGDFLGAKQINPVSEGAGSYDMLSDVQTQMKIIQSQNLMDRVLAKLKETGKLPAAHPDSRFHALRQFLRIPEAAPEAGAVSPKVLPVLTVRQSGQTRIIEIQASSSDPQVATDFANTLTSEFIESNMEARWKMSERTGEWLSRQLDEMRVKLEHSEDQLQEYARQSGLLFTAPSGNSTEKTNVSEEKLRDVQDELSKASADRAAAQSRYEIAVSASPDTIGEVLNDNSLREIQSKLTDLHRQQAELSVIYTDKAEKLQAIEAQLVPLQTEFNRERDAIIHRILNDYNTALRREKLLTADYQAQTQVVTDQADKSIQYGILKRDVDSNRQIYQAMLQQVKEASIASAIRASNVRIVDPAKRPKVPYSPNLPQNALLGVIVGGMLGIAFVLVTERADRTLQAPGDVQFWTNLPELGVIPNAKAVGGDGTYSSKIPLSAEELDLNVAVPGRKQRAIELLTWRNKPGTVAEAFRTVLTSILFVGENGTRPKVIVLTSTGPGDGKTTVVSNLAIAMAELGRKVLVVDADMRRPRMHDLFGVPNELGLSTLLRERSIDGIDSGDVISPTFVPGLSILPSGPPTTSAANLLYSPHLAELLAKFKTEYDMVLVDTPPVLQMTDARVVARVADGLVFVVRAGQTTRDAAVAACQRFSADRIRVIGTILNDWNPKTSPNGYYGSYKNAYSGGYYGDDRKTKSEA
jgi:capsular exopolysaccharide synthesis family protein